MTMNREEREMMSELSKSANELEEELEEERRHANKLADMLQAFFDQTPEHERHIIAVRGSDISWDDIVRGALALHDKRREMRPEE